MSVLRFLRNTAVDLCLGCRHDRLTRPFTIEDESYMVCLDCGRQIFYSTETMRRLSARERRRLVAARQARTASYQPVPAMQTSAARLHLVPAERDSDRAA